MNDLSRALMTCLPHRAPMLLIDAVEAVTAEGGTGRVRLDPTAWYADAQGRTPAWFGLEFMAQSVAACRGTHRAAQGGAPRGGQLVAVRGFRCAAPAFPPGADLEVRVRLQDEAPSGLATFLCEILHLGLPVAAATLTVLELP
jgi:predicted hotdog family 3-hydroxylacyl-ACP dehydratase